MRKLSLLRHAKSDWDAAVSRDFDRPLNARGRQAARRMGRYFRREGLSWDLALCSGAARARETAAFLEQGMGRGLAALYDDRYYMASAGALLDHISALDDAYESVLLIGHNPGLHDLARRLTGAGAEDARTQLARKFPAGAYAELDFDIAHWRELRPGGGALMRFVRPKALA